MPAAPSGGAVSPAQTPRANTLAVGNNRTMPLAPCQRIAARGRMPDYCASSKARTLKQLRPGMTEQSRAECEYRQRAPFALLIPFSSSTLFHPQENWDAPMQGSRASALSNWAALFPPAQLDSGDRNHFLSALFTKHTNHSLCTKHTNHGPNDAAAVPAFTPGAGASQNGGEIAATSGFPDRLQAM